MARKETKRLRDLNSSGEDTRIFERSKRTARSPTTRDRGLEEYETEENMDEIKAMMKQMMEMIKTNTEENKALREEMRRKEEKWESEKLQLEKRIEKLEHKLEEKDKERRKCNVVIKGIAEKQIYNTQGIKGWIKTNLKVDVEVKSVINLSKPDKRDMLLVELGNYQEKQDIMKNKSRLKGTEIYVEYDLTLEERKIAAYLRKTAKEEREKGKQVKIGYKKLYVNRKMYVWDSRIEALRDQEETNIPGTKN